MERKRRSEALLLERHIPVNPYLPPLAEEHEIVLRTAAVVAERAVVLLAVAARGEGLERDGAIELIEARGLWRAVTREEQTFLLTPDPTAQDTVQFIWRYESLWVLLWALGRIDLDFPQATCDVQRAASLVLDAPFPDFVERAVLRTPAEILSETDFVYRCHWATAEARFRAQTLPGNLDPGVVFERHYALNWLIGYQDQAWDDVTTDT